MCTPENIHSSLTEVIFSKTPPPWKFQLSCILFYTFFWPPGTPPPHQSPQEIPIPCVGGESAYFLELNNIQVIHFSEFFRLKRTFMFLVSYPQEHIRSFFSTSLYKLFFTQDWRRDDHFFASPVYYLLCEPLFFRLLLSKNKTIFN